MIRRPRFPDSPFPSASTNGGGVFRARKLGLLLTGATLLATTSVLPSGGEKIPDPPEAFFRTILQSPPLIQEPSRENPGFSWIHIEGFGTLQRPGAPAVPVRIQRIAIPEGASPELKILRIRNRPLGSLRLDPVPEAAPPGDARGEGDELAPTPRSPHLRPDAEVFAHDADYPASVVTLGQVGRLRDQRYVELIFAPVQVNPVRDRGRFAEEVELEVLFSGGAAPESRSGGGGSEDGFEEIYRRQILNYEQGRSFRLKPAPAVPGATPESASAPQLESAGGTVFKVALHQDGIYRVSCSASTPPCNDPSFLGHDPNTFRLRNKAVEVPMRILGGGDNSFDVGDSLEFYGQKQQAPFTTVNCSAPTCPTPIYEYDDVTDVNAYLLDVTASTARLRMATVNATPGVLTAEPHFLDTAHWEVNDYFSPLNSADPFYSLPVVTADSVNSGFRDIAVPLPGVASATFTASALARLRGFSSNTSINPDHRTTITLNGSPSTSNTADWDGETIFDQSTTAAQSLLTDPTTVRILVPVVGGLSLDQVLTDFVEISYRRLFQAQSNRLAFSFPNQAARFNVTGFTGSPILAYDLSRILSGTTGTVEPRLLINGTDAGTSLNFQVAFEGAPTGGTRKFLVLGNTGWLSPDSVAPLATSTILDPTNEADYVIIAHPSLIDLTPGSPYNQFVNYLQQTLGLKTRLVFIGEIYDAFNNSILHPEAIRSFLAYAHDQWKGPAGTSPPPRYVLLVGDAVWDFKNNLNRSDWIDLVPTPIMFYDQAILKYHAADNWLASFLGNDQSADILYGRVPARTLAQANTVFSKIRSYALSPPAGSWRSTGVFMADVGNSSQETQNFEQVQDSAVAGRFVSPWTGIKQYYAQPPYNGTDVAAYRADFFNRLNTVGGSFFSFVGHGAFDVLGNDVFFRSAVDAGSINNGGRIPFFLNSDCLSGGFHAVGIDSVGEVFLESPTGGSVAYFAPASLSFTSVGADVSQQMLNDIFSPQKIREVGTLTADARNVLYQIGGIVDMQGYSLLGDPSSSLALPAPKPPTPFTVTAGNGSVDASWAATSDPSAVGTNLYRATLPSGPYLKVNETPVGGTAYSDTSVTNGTTYFYRAVSIDSGGFEGAVTNTNADCGISGPPDGPQCRRAIPRNLVPPVAPQAVVVRDLGTGTALQITWQANPESDIFKYVIHSGTSSGVYPRVDNAGLVTTFNLQGLAPGVTYYITVSAVNTSDVEGALSSQVSGAPHVFMGIAPPATIKDLMITRSGNDLVLTWGSVNTTIYGNPATVDHYNVYRGTTPNFVPSNSINRIAVVSTPTYTHVGGVTLATDGYYLVSATDLSGFSSGLGGDLPAGITALDVRPAPTAGTLRLTWPAVNTTVTGNPALIDHYALYGSDTVLPRSLIGPGNLLLGAITGTTVDVAQPSSATYFFNLVAVDFRGNVSPY